MQVIGKAIKNKKLEISQCLITQTVQDRHKNTRKPREFNIDPRKEFMHSQPIDSQSQIQILQKDSFSKKWCVGT